MKFRASNSIWVLAACLHPGLFAQDGARGALENARGLHPLFGQRFALGHLDSDAQADGAVLVDLTPHRAGGPYRLELHLTARKNVEIAFDSSQSAHIVSAFDVDNDSDADLVVSSGPDQPGLRVWLNDGAGGFREGVVGDYPHLLHPTRNKLRADRPAQPDLAFALDRIRHSSHGLAPIGEVRGSDGDGTRCSLIHRSSSPTAQVYLAASPRGPPSLSL
jgi:hypothetical protein